MINTYQNQPWRRCRLAVFLLLAATAAHAVPPTSRESLPTETEAADNVELLFKLCRAEEELPFGFVAAEAHYKRILILTERKDVQALLGLATVNQDRNDWGTAKQLVKEAIALAPNDPAPTQRLIELLSADNQPDDAVATGEAAIKQFPNSVAIQRALGEAYRKQNKVDRALAVWQAAVKIDPHDVDTHADLAMLYFQQKKNDLMKAELDTANQIDPSNFKLAMNMGEIYVGSNDWDAAEDCYRNAAAADPWSAPVASDIGFVLAHKSILSRQAGQVDTAQKQIADAERMFELALSFNPSFQSAAKNLKTVRAIAATINQPASAPSAPHS